MCCNGQFLCSSAEDETWKYSTPIDVTSPLTLLAGRGYRLLMFSFVLSTIYELCLLFNESIEDESCSHYKFVVYLTILISFAVLVFTDDVKNTINTSQGLPLAILYAALIAEGIFYSPLATVRKRGASSDV